MPIFPDAPVRVRLGGQHADAAAAAGLASIAVDADGVIIVPLDAELHAAPPVRLSFEMIDGVTVGGGDGAVLAVHLRGGRVLEATGDARLPDVAAELLARGRVVPELTRALRTLGGRRGGDGHQEFFRPLLAARRLAAAGGDAALDAFDADALRIAVEGQLAQFAAIAEPQHLPAQRALEAQLCDAAEPLLEALPQLRAASTAASAAPPERALRAWREWTIALHRVFERADTAWEAVHHVRQQVSAVPRPTRGITGAWNKVTG